MSPSRVRHPVAAICGVLGVVTGTVAALGGGPATAAASDLTATVSLHCATVVGAGTNEFDWDAQITLAAFRPAASTTVTVTAQVSDMPGIAPVPMNDYPGTDKLVLDLAGASTTLNGSGNIKNAGANKPVPMPALRGELPSSAASLATSVTSLQLIVSGITTDCTPSGAAGMGALTIVEGAAPTIAPTPTPTTTTSATATPSASATASATPTSGPGKGKPAKGTVPFACELSIGSTFDYKAAVAVSGYREKKGDDVSLVATMSDLPGIAPVIIQGPMDYTLDAKVGGEKVTLKSTGEVNAQPNDDVPVKSLTGSVGAEDDELEVVVTGFTFDFPSGGVGAECVASAVSLGKLKVGSEPVAEDDTDSSVSASGGTTTSGGGASLPQTGGGDALPVVGLWAVALVLLGAAGLLCVPSVAHRRH